MEKEVSSAIELSVTLIALTLVVTLIIFTVTMGGSIREESYAEAVTISSSLENDTLEELADNFITEMPAVTAYNLILQNPEYIAHYECTYCEAKTGVKTHGFNPNTKDGICLKTHLQGKVNLIVNKVAPGTYYVAIHSTKCTKSTKDRFYCSCSGYKHLSNCPQSKGGSYCICSHLLHKRDPAYDASGSFTNTCYLSIKESTLKSGSSGGRRYCTCGAKSAFTTNWSYIN